MTKRLLSTVTIFVALLGVAAAQQTVSETHPLDPDGVVTIDNMAGSVKVVGWNEGRVEVTGTLAKEVDRVEVKGDQSRVKIRVVMERGTRTMDATKLEVHVPTNCRLAVEGVSTRIDVEGLEGHIELESVSGDLSVKGSPRDLEAESVSGSINVESAPDRAKLESVSGDIEVARVQGELEASSVSGEIKVLGGVLAGGEVSTTSGDIRLEVDLGGRGRLSVESMSGAVVMVVPASISADFELSTFSGSITNEIGPPPERSSDYTPGQELRFEAGTGGPRVSVSSFSGSVKLLTQ